MFKVTVVEPEGFELPADEVSEIIDFVKANPEYLYAPFASHHVIVIVTKEA